MYSSLVAHLAAVAVQLGFESRHPAKYLLYLELKKTGTDNGTLGTKRVIGKTKKRKKGYILA